MAIIYTNQKSKPKKKPGWKKEQAEYEAWLAKHGQTTTKKPSNASKRSSKAVVLRPTHHSYIEQEKAKSAQSSSTLKVFDTLPKVSTEVKIHDPKVLYKDNPEMLERELKARERKFAVAPAFNKGGDQLVTPDMMKDIMAGGGRRRS